MEFLHLIRLVRWLDRCSLWSLRRWVPDVQEVLDAPAEVLQYRVIEIGPWKRYVEGYFVPALLAIPALVALLVGNLTAVTACVNFVLLLLAGWLVYAFRGGRCRIHATGVEFHYRGSTVFCPWDLFHTDGQPVYYENRERLDLPAAPAAISGVEVRKHESVVAQGLDARTRHFQFLPTGEIRLLLVYGVKPVELGHFLLELGRQLGTPVELATPAAPFLSDLTAKLEESGWMRVSLTRLRFPPICCDCGTATDDRQQFRAHRSLPATEEFARLLVPVCRQCRRVNRRRYWWTWMKTFFLVVIGVSVLSFLLGLVLDFVGATPGPGAMTVIMTLTGLLASLGLSWLFAAKRARTVSEPLRLSDYRPGEGTIRLRFRNEKYGEVLLAATRGA